MDNDAPIWDLLREVRDEQRKTNDVINTIVGREHCEAYRKEYSRRLSNVEAFQIMTEATKGELVSDTELQAAKEAAIQAAGLACAPVIVKMQADIEDIKNKTKILDISQITYKAVTGNPFLKNLMYAGTIAFIFILYKGFNEAISQFGIKDVMMFTISIIVLVSLFWISRGQNRGKFMGLIK